MEKNNFYSSELNQSDTNKLRELIFNKEALSGYDLYVDRFIKHPEGYVEVDNEFGNYLKGKNHISLVLFFTDTDCFAKCESNYDNVDVINLNYNDIYRKYMLEKFKDNDEYAALLIDALKKERELLDTKYHEMSKSLDESETELFGAPIAVLENSSEREQKGIN